MNPEDDPTLAALGALGTKMRRGRFKDALPEEEQREITLVLTPGGGAEIVSDTGAMGEEPMDAMEPDGDEMAPLPDEDMDDAV